MKKVQYTSKAGKLQWRPVFDKDFERAAFDGNTGFCLACGSDVDGVEPDARGYTCEQCQQPKVFGLEELVIMRLAR